MNIRTKDELLEQLSLAVEQIQKQYVQGSDVIKDSPETFFLCNSVDKILHHGLKEGLISWAIQPSIWPLLEKITCAKDIEEINMLCLKTDKEKCSAWIQMAVNVNLLGSYISTLQQDKSLLSNHYYEYAFLRDPVLSDTVKSLLNYGIANFDFQITVDRTPEHSNETRKQKTVIVNDSSEDTKAKELSNVEPDGLNKESFTDKKKRKKKKPPSIHTVVISDLDNNDETTDNINPETVNLTNGDSNYQETKQNLEEIMENYDSADSNDKPLKHIDNGHVNLSNSLNSKAINESVFDNQNSDVDLTLHSDKPTSDYDVTIERRTPTEYQPHHTNDIEQQTEKRQLSDEANEHKTTIFGSSEIEEYMLAQSLGNETRQSEQNSTLNGDDINKPVESDSCKANSVIPRTEFSANDFLLDENCKDEERCDVSDVEEKLNDVRNDATTHSMSENLDSRNLKENHETITPKVENSTTLEKSEKNGSPDEDCMSDRYSSPLDDSGAHDSNNLREISDERAFNYRVKKMENPEFISSSYGSTFSDVTDTSYDDRDMNFIPGIHPYKLPSSYKSGSSYDRKSTLDSSVSFDANGLPVFDTSHYTESSSRPSSIDDSSGRFADLANEWDMYEDLLNVEEEHFSGPDNFGGLSTSEELEIAIEHYKKMIKVKQNKSDRDELVQKLIKLRLRLQKEKDGPPAVNPKFRKILGHHFSKEEDTSGRKYSCDQCGKVIWIIWQSLFTCKDCDYHSHRKCLEHIERPCPNRNLSSVSYILDICPDTGLDVQQYRCAECRKAIAFSKVGVAEARSCDYTGQYFCDQCHWNDQVSIPARVLHNWDFMQYKVCRQTKQLLDLMKTRPLLNLQQINPMLFRYVEELREVGKLREDILVMKKYFLTCREALESKLLIQLEKRQHFVDSSDIYSLQDLLDLNNDVLLPEISKVHALFLAHIKADCELCRARGFICEVCQDSSDVIFAFDPHVIKCTKCSAVYHKICFKPDECPKCHRKRKVVERT